MSESVPKRKLYEKIEIMQTSTMEERGLANKKGMVIKVLENDDYIIKLEDSVAYSIVINGCSLRGRP